MVHAGVVKSANAICENVAEHTVLEHVVLFMRDKKQYTQEDALRVLFFVRH